MPSIYPFVLPLVIYSRCLFISDDLVYCGGVGFLWFSNGHILLLLHFLAFVLIVIIVGVEFIRIYSNIFIVKYIRIRIRFLFLSRIYSYSYSVFIFETNIFVFVFGGQNTICSPMIRAPEVPFLVPPKRPKQPKLPIFNTFALFSILEILVGPRRFQRRIVT